jgi:hypothetical protein
LSGLYSQGVGIDSLENPYYNIKTIKSNIKEICFLLKLSLTASIGGRDMKQYRIILLSGFLLWNTYTSACELSLASDKEAYKTGDTAIVTLTLKLTHTNCALEGRETKIKITGGELKAKTKFKEISPALWQIKYKIVITAKDILIQAIQDCVTNGGSTNKLKLNVGD